MSTSPEWASMPAVLAAAHSGDYARILRLARTAAGLPLEQAGRLAGYSPSAMSRLETGRRRTCDAKELRHLALMLEIPLDLLGLSASPDAPTPASLTMESDDGGDPMRRRTLLTSGVLAVTGIALRPLQAVAAADGMTDTIEDVLAGRLNAAPIAGQQLAAQIAATRADFRACRYTQLAHRLPRLLAQATTAHDQAPEGQRALASGRLAQAYGVATQLLSKLHDDGMAWATSDRAVQAAHACGDPLIEAEAARTAVTVLRRTQHRSGARRMILHAAEQLQTATKLKDPAHATMYAQLLAAASYTAALNDDRDSAHTLLHEAETAHLQNPTGSEQFTALDLAVYKISVARTLGDYGVAVEYAQLIDPTQITAPERRARYWEDAALSLHGRGRTEATYRALLAAEADTPQEVRYRPWAQQLTRDLVSADNRHALPGIRDFAQRIGATV
jgi:transcriptional regulator with XRE-family HTH domain